MGGATRAADGTCSVWNEGVAVLMPHAAAEEPVAIHKLRLAGHLAGLHQWRGGWKVKCIAGPLDPGSEQTELHQERWHR